MFATSTTSCYFTPFLFSIRLTIGIKLITLFTSSSYVNQRREVDNFCTFVIEFCLHLSSVVIFSFLLGQRLLTGGPRSPRGPVRTLGSFDELKKNNLSYNQYRSAPKIIMSYREPQKRRIQASIERHSSGGVNFQT